MLFLVLVADFFVLVFNRFLFFRFSFSFQYFFVLVLVFVNEIVIFSFLVIFVFVNENHTGHATVNHARRSSQVAHTLTEQCSKTTMT